MGAALALALAIGWYLWRARGKGAPEAVTLGTSSMPPQMEREGDVVTLRDTLLDALAMYGADGWDEDGLVDALAADGFDEEAVEQELRRMMREGLVVGVGCSWVALSNEAWLDRAMRTVREQGLCEDASIVRCVVDLLVPPMSKSSIPQVEAADRKCPCGSCVTCPCGLNPQVDQDGLCLACGGQPYGMAVHVPGDVPHVGVDVEDEDRATIAAMLVSVAVQPKAGAAHQDGTGS